MNEHVRTAVDYWSANCALSATHVFGLTWPPPGRAQRKRIVGHWGCNPGIAWIVGHLAAQWIYEEPFLTIVGTGHASSFLFAHMAIAKNLSATDISRDAASYGQPGGTPTEIFNIQGLPHHGGELGQALAVSQGIAAFSSVPLTVCVIGDGECETPAALAALVHADILLRNEKAIPSANWLPVINVNGARMGSRSVWNGKRLEAFLIGIGYRVFRSKTDPLETAEVVASIIRACLDGERVVWVSETTKGWPAPADLGGQVFSGIGAHKPRGLDPFNEEARLGHWLQGLVSGVLDSDGNLHSRIKNVANRTTLSLHTETRGRRAISLPEVYTTNLYGLQSPIEVIDQELAEKGILVFSPDEASSNRLDICLRQGQVIEVLAEQTCVGWAMGSVEAGCEAAFVSYEAFAPLVATSLAQYHKLIQERPAARRPPMLVIQTSLGWANCPSHQNTDLVGTALARWGIDLICPLGATSARKRLRSATNRRDRIVVVTSSKQRLLDIADPGSSIVHIRMDHAKSLFIARIVAMGDICVNEAVAAMAWANEFGVNIEVLAVVELGNASEASKLIKSYQHDPSTIGLVWCASEIIASSLWESIGAAFDILGYREFWGATPWENLQRNRQDRFSILSNLSNRGLLPSEVVDKFSVGIDAPYSGGEYRFDLSMLRVSCWKSEVDK